MCGFAGFCSPLADSRRTLARMTARIVHRGPDSEGFFIEEPVALGFRRLSIIDLSSVGDQPFSDESGRYHMVFNGEIYNYRTIREALVEKGHVFRSQTDTEVLLRGYIEYGEAVLDKLRGMFAFVIWDSKEKTLFGARDIFGIKPFYYANLPDGGFGFASEIKSLLEYPGFAPRVNLRMLRSYLTLQYSAGAETFFEGVYKLPPAHAFVYREGKLTVRRYMDVRFDARVTDMDEAAAIIDKTLKDSVEAHRVSDVPIGAFLSGGVDSSYVTACMMPEKTFSVGFSYEKFDETAQAAELSEILGVGNCRRHLDAKECFDAFPTIQYHMDEPQANPSCVPLYFLAELARKEVTVVLSGEGADELFGGYEWYADTPSMKKYKRLPAFLRRMAAGVAARLPYFKGHDFLLKCSGRPEDYFVGQARVFSEREADKILRPSAKVGQKPLDMAAPYYVEAEGYDEITKKQYLDLSMWLPGDILLKADKMSMAHSLELRVPYLDREMLKVATALSGDLRVSGDETKAAMRRASEKTLPEEWVKRPKKGFPVPIRYWLREEEFAARVRAEFSSEAASTFFDSETLLSMLEEHKRGKANHARKIWVVYTFLVWYRVFFIDFDNYLPTDCVASD